MNEIVAAIIGALLAGPAGFFIERFLSRPRIELSYARLEFEDVIVLNIESHQAIVRYESFASWMDSQVPWNFKQSAQGNYFSRDEIRILRDLALHYMGIQKGILERLAPRIAALGSDQKDEVEKTLFEFLVDYHQIFNKQLAEDYKEDQKATIERLKSHLEAAVNNTENIGIPLLETISSECQQHLDNGRGTSERLIVRVGIGNRGIQDGLIEAEAALQAVERVFRLPVKLTKRPWYTEDVEGGALDSSYLRLPARSFRVLDFLIDENFNARADLDKLTREIRNGTPAKFTSYGLGRKKIASIQFTARLPDNT